MKTIAQWNYEYQDETIPATIANYYDIFSAAVAEYGSTRIVISSDEGYTAWTWTLGIGWRILA